VIVTSFVLGLVSVVLRRSKRLGLAGISIAVVSVLLGGSEVPVEVPVPKSNHLSLDWFLLDLLLMAILFVPLERLFPRVEQPIVNHGFITVPNKPGLGLELNDEVVKQHLLEPGYFEPTPEWDHERSWDRLFS